MTITDIDEAGEAAEVWANGAGDLLAGAGLLHCTEPGCDYAAQPGPRQAAALARHRTRSHPAEPRGYSAPAPPVDDLDGPPTTPGDPAEEPDADPKETAPRPAVSSRGGLFRKWRDRARRTPSAGTGAPRPKAAAKPRPTGKRMPIAGDVSELYSDIAARLKYTPHYPAGRMLEYQAPAAGVIIDDAIAGTAVDRFAVQPIMRNKDKYESVIFLVAPPVLMFMIQNAAMSAQVARAEGRDEEAAKLELWVQRELTSLKWVLRKSLIRMAPAIAEARERAAAEDEVIREAFPELMPGVDPVDALLSDLFKPPGQEAPNVEQSV